MCRSAFTLYIHRTYSTKLVSVLYYVCNTHCVSKFNIVVELIENVLYLMSTINDAIYMSQPTVISSFFYNQWDTSPMVTKLHIVSIKFVSLKRTQCENIKKIIIIFFG